MRIIAWKNSSVVNVCDAELIGKTLVEGKLKFHVSKEFFGGDLLGEEETAKILRESSMISLAGKKSVEMALAHNMGSPKAIREIEGVPFLMIYKF